MREELRYEVPEILELGDAGDLTLGMPNLPCDDACDCAKAASELEEVDG
jgi:hypothetical protein